MISSGMTEGGANDKVLNDVNSGARAYNRLDFQISQAIHMILEQYAAVDFVVIMDYKEDLTFYPDMNNNADVCYYQIKTNEEVINIVTIDHIKWVAKLYDHLKGGSDSIDEIGLITVYPIRIGDKKFSSNRSLIADSEKEYELLQDGLSKLLNKPKDEIDLKKLIHIRTPLTIFGHEEMIKGELFDYILKKNSSVTLEIFNVVYLTIRQLLENCQKYELLSENESFDRIKRCKGFSREQFEEVIEKSILVQVPAIDTIILFFSDIPDNDKEILESVYSHLISDQMTRKPHIGKLFQKIEKDFGNVGIGDKSPWIIAIDYAADVCDDSSIWNVLKNSKHYIALAVLIYLYNREMSL